MKKKLLAVLLSILMLVMPMASLAESSVWDDPARTETTVTLHDMNAAVLGELDESTVNAITDLLAALSLTSYQQGNERGLSVNLSGKSVLAASILESADDSNVTYATSSLFDGTIAVNSNDMENIGNKYLRAVMKMNGMSDEEIDAEFAKQQETLDVAVADVTPDFNAVLEAGAAFASMSGEDLLAELEQADLSQLQALLSTDNQAQLEAVTEQPDDCDPAAQYAKTTVPVDEMNQALGVLLETLHSVPSVGAYMDAFVAYGGTSWDELLAQVKEIQPYAGDAVGEVWLTEDNQIVRFAATLLVDNDGEEPMPISFVLARKTVDDVATWLGTFKTVDDTVLTLGFTGDAANFTAELTFYMDGTETGAQSKFILQGKNIDTDNSALDLEIQVTNDDEITSFGFALTVTKTMDGAQGVCTANLVPRFMGVDIVTFTVEKRTCDAQTAMDVTDVRDLGAMTDEEFQTWFVRVLGQVQNLPMTLMMNLPDSVLTLLMSTGN